jgi:hypothetical protein
MPYRRNENILDVTERLRRAHARDMGRYAMWIALCAGFYLADVAVNVYWKATTGHTLLECYILHPAGCDAPSMKIHGE